MKESFELKDLTIVIVNYNLTEEIRLLLGSIQKYGKNVKYNTVVVDNNSPDTSITELKNEFKDVDFVFLDNNYGFGFANNIGLKKYDSAFYLLLNPDTLLVDNLIESLINLAQSRRDLGIIGPKVFYNNGRLQISALEFPNLFHEFFQLIGLLPFYVNAINWLKVRRKNCAIVKTDFIFGSCMLIRKEVFDKIGGFDEDYFLFSEEADLCFRLLKQTKFKVGFWKKGKILHHGSKITGENRFQRLLWVYNSKLLFFNKNYTYLYHLILRSIVVFSFLIRYLLIPITKSKESRNIAFYSYGYIIKLFSKNKPILRNDINKLQINR